MAGWPPVRIALFVLMLVIVPPAQAGSRDDPEVVDDANDVSRYPGVPTVDPTVDILGIWFTEEAGELVVHLEMAQIGNDVPELSNVNSGESYFVSAFVDGENPGDERCSSWGDFGVRWSLGQSTGTLSYGWHYDGNACPAEDAPIAVAVEDNVITWTIPMQNLAMLRAGSEVTVARADAWSGDTWPATPGDDADNLPGRVFVVQTVPTPANATSGTSVTQAEAQADIAREPPTSAPGTDSKDAPANPLGLLAVALALVLVLRRA